MIVAPDVLAYWRDATPYMRHEDGRASHVDSIAKRLPPPRSALDTLAIDYGCGGGAGLEALSAAGYSPIGVDLVTTNERFPVLRPEQMSTIPERRHR